MCRRASRAYLHTMSSGISKIGETGFLNVKRSNCQICATEKIAISNWSLYFWEWSLYFTSYCTMARWLNLIRVEEFWKISNLLLYFTILPVITPSLCSIRFSTPATMYFSFSKLILYSFEQYSSTILLTLHSWDSKLLFIFLNNTSQKRCTKTMFSVKDFFSKCDQIRSFQRIRSYLLKKSLMENFIFCAVKVKRIFLSFILRFRSESPSSFKNQH